MGQLNGAQSHVGKGFSALFRFTGPSSIWHIPVWVTVRDRVSVRDRGRERGRDRVSESLTLSLPLSLTITQTGIFHIEEGPVNLKSAGFSICR